MPTITETQAQLQQAKANLMKSQQEAQSFKPKIEMTRLQLQQQTPTTSTRIQESERLRGIAKEQALSKISQQQSELNQYEQSFDEWLRSPEGIKSYSSEFGIAPKVENRSIRVGDFRIERPVYIYKTPYGTYTDLSKYNEGLKSLGSQVQETYGQESASFEAIAKGIEQGKYKGEVLRDRFGKVTSIKVPEDARKYLDKKTSGWSSYLDALRKGNVGLASAQTTTTTPSWMQQPSNVFTSTPSSITGQAISSPQQNVLSAGQIPINPETNRPYGTFTPAPNRASQVLAYSGKTLFPKEESGIKRVGSLIYSPIRSLDVAGEVVKGAYSQYAQKTGDYSRYGEMINLAKESPGLVLGAAATGEGVAGKVALGALNTLGMSAGMEQLTSPAGQRGLSETKQYYEAQGSSPIWAGIKTYAPPATAIGLGAFGVRGQIKNIQLSNELRAIGDTPMKVAGTRFETGGKGTDYLVGYQKIGNKEYLIKVKQPFIQSGETKTMLEGGEGMAYRLQGKKLTAVRFESGGRVIEQSSIPKITRGQVTKELDEFKAGVGRVYTQPKVRGEFTLNQGVVFPTGTARIEALGKMQAVNEPSTWQIFTGLSREKEGYYDILSGRTTKLRYYPAEDRMTAVSRIEEIGKIKRVTPQDIYYTYFDGMKVTGGTGKGLKTIQKAKVSPPTYAETILKSGAKLTTPTKSSSVFEDFVGFTGLLSAQPSSAYTGTGQYERTGGITGLTIQQPRTNQIVSPLNIQASASATKLEQKQFPFLQTSQLLNQQLKQQQSPFFNNAVLDRAIQKLKQSQLLNLEQKQQQKQVTKQIQKQQLIQQQKPLQRAIAKIRGENLYFGVGKAITPQTEKNGNSILDIEEGFDIILGVNPKTQKKIRISLPKEEAMFLGSQLAKRTIKASFGLTPSGRKAESKGFSKFVDLGQFVPSKTRQGFYVEQRKFRLDLPEEKRIIMGARNINRFLGNKRNKKKSKLLKWW